MILVMIVALGTTAALWLPQRPLRIILSLMNAVVVMAILIMLVRRRN